MSIVDDARRDYLAMLSERRQEHENTKEETIRKNPSLLEIRKEISRIYTDEIRGLHNADETDRLVADAEKRFDAEAESSAWRRRWEIMSRCARNAPTPVSPEESSAAV
ncbi:MAG: hypothetical protein IKD81_08205 [Eubacteriaceae bacterium]|nr:hypothetical protein [Eubacteriaceae bacterium]